jgi:hypothetical protein
MSWWDTGEGDDLIGDIPADIIGGMFKSITKASEEQGNQKPTLQEVLNSIKSALSQNPEEILADGKGISVQKVVAELENKPDEVSSGEPINTLDELVVAFRKAFEAVTQEYKDALERKPRLSELLACIVLVLGSSPEDYLSIEAGACVEKIVAELS